MLSKGKDVEETLSEMDSQMKSFEDEHLLWFPRIKRRFWNWRTILMYQVSSGITLGQILGGKWLIAWCSSKVAVLSAVGVKAWGAISTTLLGIWHIMIGWL